MKKTLKIVLPVLLLAVILMLVLHGCELAKAADARATETPSPSAAVIEPTPSPAAANPVASEKPAESVPPTQVPATPAPSEKPAEATPAPAATPAPTQKPAATTRPQPTPTPAPAHTHGWSESGHSAATCTAAGSKTYTCSCGETRIETIAALGHDWQGVYVTEQYPIYGEAENHWYCNDCNADITGMTSQQHHEATGCPAMGYHNDYVYPITGYGTEEVLTGYQCSRCGETKAP